MGNPRHRPELLAEKLLAIREFLNLGQQEMAETLKREIISHSRREFQLHPGRISEYETGKREPNLFMLIAYGRLAQVHLESFADDEIPIQEFQSLLGKEVCYVISKDIEQPHVEQQKRKPVTLLRGAY